MDAIVIALIIHWYGSVFVQTFFLHRYSAHRMFTMSSEWENFFYWLTYLFQGSSYLNPRAYALLHNQHHQFSDTEKDPHSPHFHSNALGMMARTAVIYQDLVDSKEDRHHAEQLHHRWLDRFADTWWSRIAWGLLYLAFYLAFAPSWHWFLLLPIHFLMGPIHGAIVNWCGHKYGYRNFSTADRSVNTLPWDLLVMGELYQNNHHQNGKSPCFAQRPWELDPTYPLLLIFHWLGVIQLKSKKGTVDVEALVKELHECTQARWMELTQRFRHNEGLVRRLWKVRKQEAHVFALSIVDWQKVSSARLDYWAREIVGRKSRKIFVTKIVLSSPHSQRKLKAWTNSHWEKVQECGYDLMASLAMKDVRLSQKDWVSYLESIVNKFQQSNRPLRRSMKVAYLRVAQRNDELMVKACELADGIDSLMPKAVPSR